MPPHYARLVTVAIAAVSFSTPTTAQQESTPPTTLEALVETLGGRVSQNEQGAVAQEDEQAVFVRLLDSETGSPVTDLRAEEFAIWQGGVECEVVSAELVETRLQLALVLDESEWMVNYRRHLRNGMPQLLDALPEGSEVSLIATDPPSSRISLDFTTDMALVRERFDEYSPWSGSVNRMLDTLHRTADNLMKEDGEEGVPEGGALWPVIAVIGSDGVDASGGQAEKIDTLMPKLSELRATVHWLTLKTAGGRFVQLREPVAEFFTSSTGGRYDRVATVSQIAVEKMALMGATIAQQHALREAQYRVVFKPRGPDWIADLSAGVTRPETLVLMSLDGRLE